MNEVQKIQFDMLVKLDEICRKNNLTYYLAYGTCIGAVRHKGFIPWDHDVDVLMPFDDARKLAEYQAEFEPNYFISNYLNDTNNKTTKVLLIDKRYKCRVIENGVETEVTNVCMDIYPFYKCPKSKFALLTNIWRSHAYKLLVGGIPQNHGTASKVIGSLILFFIPQKHRKRMISEIEKKLNYKGESYEISDFYGYDIKLMSAITYLDQWFTKPSIMQFEGKMFYGPTNVDKYLTKRYGDYMTPVSKNVIEKEAKLELVKED